jgi:hypothetical protein
MTLQRPIIAIAALAGGLTLLGGVAVAGGWGPHRGPTGQSLLESFDTNQDGKLTQAEIDESRKANLAKYDTDGNAELTLAEYEALWAAAMRQAMVRQFQANDADGNGSVTVEEFTVRFEDVVADLDRNGDGQLTRDELRRRGHRGPHGHGPGGPGRDGDAD